MKRIFKKILPSKIKGKIQRSMLKHKLKKEYKEDYKRYVKNTYIFAEKKDKRHFEADLIFYYHKIEKGLALSKPRLKFGKKNVYLLVDKLEDYTKSYGWDETAMASLNALSEYIAFNQKHNEEMPELYTKVNKLKENIPVKIMGNIGGTKYILKSEIENLNIDFEKFTYSRYSIRNYTNEEVDNSLIENAIKIAQKTPSVCNRQSAKVHIYETDKDKNEILKFQNGNAGFGNNADKILIVTMELKDFRGIIERNQSYIDGGMYAMSLIYGLHAQGLGTCPLNLSIINDTERKLKKAANISDSEQLIMMIAVGHIPSELKVAYSPRRSINEVLTIH